MSYQLIANLFGLLNEVLTAATVIVAISMLLYNLAHGPRDRVARASSVLMGCVTLIYVGDVFVAISKAPSLVETWLRFEWIGIAFAPAAFFHLSDALLATTGLISRGRRRRVVRLLYMMGSVFLLTAAFTDLIIHSLLLDPLPLMEPGPLFWLYVVYFVLATLFSFNNVLRARRRCLTRATHRRMTYLLFALVTPVAGIFPFTLLFPQPSPGNALWLWFLINMGNLGIVLMLTFLAYPLSVFGSKKPDRVIKAELLSFMLRGPVTGIAVLVVIMAVPHLSSLGMPGPALTPFFAVATVLGLQWSFGLIIPFLERKLIYTRDQEQARRIQELGARLLTQSDARQLLEATLTAICDYLRVSSAFVATMGPEGVHLEQTVGALQPSPERLNAPDFVELFNYSNGNGQPRPPDSLVPILIWQSFWLLPLRSTRTNGHNGRQIGIMGIWARSPVPDLLPEEEKVFQVLHLRAARVLDDMRLEEELFARLEDMLEETNAVQGANDPVRYGNALEVARLTRGTTSLIDQPDFIDVIREALRDYWGGPRLTDNRLLQMKIVEQSLAENENNPAKTIRAVLNKAIERLKPEGQRSLTLPEWTLYNIIDLRFVQGKKVRDSARQLAMSDADLYRKQRIAIEQIAHEMAEMERRAQGIATPEPVAAPVEAVPTG